jgi:hypothetical protein
MLMAPAVRRQLVASVAFALALGGAIVAFLMALGIGG